MKSTTFPLLALLVVFTGAAFPMFSAAGPAAGPAAGKPAWLTDASVALKETYDDNVFASGADARFLPATYTVPAGSVAALKDQASWVTTVSPKLGVNLAPLFNQTDVLPAFSLIYAPDFAIFHEQSSETYYAQRFLTAIKAKSGPLSLALNNTFSYVEGNEFGPTYPGSLFNCYVNSAVRERREQIQDCATIAIQYNWRKYFIRPVASLSYYDLMTAQLNAPGYQSYVDRYDVNGGLDVGYQVAPNFSVILGYRSGYQYQQSFVFSPYDATSRYQRLLFGLEGKPWKWLEVKILAGPDFRDYLGNNSSSIVPVNDHHPVKYYGEALIVASVTPADTITFKYKQWQWVSSTGKVPYYDSTFDLSYRRKLTDSLGLDLGGKILGGDYTSGNLAACRRNDLDYVILVGLAYTVNSHVSLNLGYNLEIGRNAADNIANETTREFQRNQLSAGLVMKF